MHLKKILIVLIAILLVGCEKAPASGGSDVVIEDPNDTLIVQIESDLKQMDYQIGTDETSFILESMCFSGLTSLDENGLPVAEIASSWDISSDNLTYTFHLRNDAKWSNGEPITANDFVYAWKRLANLKSDYSSFLRLMHVVSADDGENLGVEATDDTTFVVHLETPCDYFLKLTAFPCFYPINQEFFEAQGDQYAKSIDNLLFSGPYEMTTWEKENQYVFSKRDDYFNRQDNTVGTVIFRLITNTQTAMLQYQEGNLDVVNIHGDQVSLYKNENGFNYELSGRVWYLPFNYANEKLQNDSLRTALYYAIDATPICDDILDDGSVVAKGIVPAGIAQNNEGQDYRALVGDINTFQYEEAIKYYRTAKRELGGEHIQLELLTEDSERAQAVAQNLKDQWETAIEGLTIEIKVVTRDKRIELMKSQQYELAITNWATSYDDPYNYLDLFVSGNTSVNYGRYNRPEYDELIVKAATGENAGDTAKRFGDFIAAEQMATETDHAVLPLVQEGYGMIIRPTVSGIHIHMAAIDDYRNVTKGGEQ